MGKIFVEVFREQVPIAVRLEDITEHVKHAREMRIIVSYDPANPGIELIFGRLEIDSTGIMDALQLGNSYGLGGVICEAKKEGFITKLGKTPRWDPDMFNAQHEPELKRMSQRDWEREYLCMPALPCMSFHEFINIVSQSFKHLNLRDKDLLGRLDPQYYEKFIDEINKGPIVSLVAVCRKFGLKWKN
ncbi:hypothetical protein [Sphingobacterium anhuiense]|uniref:hypothetical protein n=1 Tax=Sphingobacterium anhuiense TaxID=493780 RepID=UPI003C2B74B4